MLPTTASLFSLLITIALTGPSKGLQDFTLTNTTDNLSVFKYNVELLFYMTILF